MNINDLLHVQCFPRAPNWSWIFRTRLVTRVCWLKTIRLYCCSCHVLLATCRTSAGNQTLPANEWPLPSRVRCVSWLSICEFIITSQKADNHLLFFKNHFLFWRKKCVSITRWPKVTHWMNFDLWIWIFFCWCLFSNLLLWFINKVIFITVPAVKCLCFINMVFWPFCCLKVCRIELPFNNLDKNLSASHWSVAETVFFHFAKAAPQYCVQRIWGPLQFLSELHCCHSDGPLFW